MSEKEDYPRIILELQKENKKAKVTEIARLLNINKASVSEMIKKLAKQKLVIAKPYSSILLTKQGKKEAKKISHKHKTLIKFTKDILNHSHKKAHEEAHKLEHAISLELINKMNKYMENLNKPDSIKMEYTPSKK